MKTYTDTILFANTKNDTKDRNKQKKYKNCFAAAATQWHKNKSAQEVQNQYNGDIRLSKAILIINGASGALGS